MIKIALSKDLSSPQKDLCKGIVENFRSALKNNWIRIVRDDEKQATKSIKGIQESGSQES